MGKQKKSNKGIILVSIVIIAIIAGILFIYFSPGILQSEKEKTNDTPQTVRGENLLLDAGFENITSLASGRWGIAGYTTTNITAIIYNEELYGFKIENNTLKYHNEIKYNGSMSAYIQGIDVFNITVISNWNQNINDTNLIPYGKDIELSCWIKTIEAEEAILMIQCWDKEDFSIDNLIASQSSKSYDVINGTNSWEKYSIKLVHVPSNTKVITVRLGLIGTGEIWFDDVELVIVS